jgi:hypothetical protein
VRYQPGLVQCLKEYLVRGSSRLTCFTAILASTREGQRTKSHMNFERAEASNLFKIVQNFRSCARKIECILLGGILVLQRSQRKNDTRGETNSTSFVTRLRATPPTEVLSSHSPTLSSSHNSLPLLLLPYLTRARQPHPLHISSQGGEHNLLHIVKRTCIFRHPFLPSFAGEMEG